MSLRPLFFVTVSAVSAAAAVYTPPRYDTASVPTTAALNSTVAISAQFTTQRSDDAGLNDATPDQLKLYRIIMYVTKPDGLTDIVADWIPGWPIGSPSAENSVSHAGSFVASQVGVYAVSFTAMDGRPWFTSSPTFITTVTAPTPAITSSLAALNLAVNQAFTYTVTATNSPTSFSATGLPPGFTLNPATGSISGTATTAGFYGSTIGATNRFGSATASLPWNVIAPVITNRPGVSPDSLTLGSSLTLTPSGSANFGVAWIERVIFPPTGAGFHLGTQYAPNHNAPASYTPVNGTGTYTFLTRVVDPSFNFTDSAVTFTVLPPPPVITSPATLGLLFGQTASYQTTATSSPTSFGFAWTTQPPGAAVFANGLLTATPSAVGTFGFTVSASNAGGTGSRAITFTVGRTTPALAFSGQSFPTSVLLSATQLNASPANPYNPAAIRPTGAVTYQISAGSGSNASPAGALAPGSTLLPGSYTVRATYAGDTNYNPTSTDVTFTVANASPLIANLSATPSTVSFGQASSISTTATDVDGNLYAHALLFRSSADGNWSRPPGTNYSLIGWNVYPADTANIISGSTSSDDVPTGQSSSTKALVFTAGTALTYVFHANASDGSSYSSNGPTFNLIVAKATPTISNFGSRSYSSGLPAYTWTAADSAAMLSNPFSGRVAPPTGPVSFSVVGPGTMISPGTQLGPGTYTIRAIYAGDQNYNPTSVDATLTYTQLPPVITSAATANGILGASFTYAITATNHPTSFSISGSLPPGLGFAPGSGTLAGTPRVPGTFPLTISAANAAGSSVRTLALTIADLAVASSGTIIFPNVIEGASSTRTAAINNEGNTALSVQFSSAFGDQVASDFAAPAAALTIPVGATIDVPLTFTPTGTGAKTGSFLLFTTDSTATPKKFVLQGSATTSTPPQPPSAAITADRSTIRVGQSTTIRATYAAGTYDVLADTSIDAPPGNPVAGADGFAQTFRTFLFTPTAVGSYPFVARAVTPNFAWTQYASTTVNVAPPRYTLTVSVSGPGNASPLGSSTFDWNEVATAAASWPSNALFTGWTGDASGTSPTINLVMNSDKAVTAVFAGKAAQTITFLDPGAQLVGPAFDLFASASSGLPVAVTVSAGNAFITGTAASGYKMTITSAGAAEVTATQPGNAAFLPAPAVVRSINGVTAVLKIRQDTDRVKILRGDPADNPTVIIGRP